MEFDQTPNQPSSRSGLSGQALELLATLQPSPASLPSKHKSRSRIRKPHRRTKTHPYGTRQELIPKTFETEQDAVPAPFQGSFKPRLKTERLKLPNIDGNASAKRLGHTFPQEGPKYTLLWLSLIVWSS
eukprot:TRINITY_DN8689_c0_g1_i3.p2 TRINITY_DN8689_c0_g1~~TRINITY_DN8689_c0_g1_i3.p2  ORF type:complete len:150 (+),score=3.61 TRINITY_DN8689_c0_g1_i3:65-451(+)